MFNLYFNFKIDFSKLISQLFLITLFWSNSLYANATFNDLVVPSDPEDIYVFSDLDYTWFGHALFTPIRAFLRGQPGASADIRFFNSLPPYIDLTEFERNKYANILGSAEITRSRELVQLEKDPLGILIRPDFPVPLGFYFIDENFSFGEFRDYPNYDRLSLDVEQGFMRAEISKFKIEGPTFEVIRLMVNAGYSENVTIVTARGQEIGLQKLYQMLIRMGVFNENAFGKGPHSFALSHPSAMVFGRNGIGDRKNLILHHAIGVYNSHAAAAEKRRLVIVAEDKPEYVQRLGEELRAMSSVKTFTNLDYVLLNTGTEEQRRNAIYPHKAGFYRLGRYYALPDNFMKKVADKLKIHEKTNKRKSSKQNRGANVCEIFLT